VRQGLAIKRRGKMDGYLSSFDARACRDLKRVGHASPRFMTGGKAHRGCADARPPHRPLPEAPLTATRPLSSCLTFGTARYHTRAMVLIGTKRGDDRNARLARSARSPWTALTGNPERPPSRSSRSFLMTRIAFFVSIGFSLLAWGIVAARYLWPALRHRSIACRERSSTFPSKGSRSWYCRRSGSTPVDMTSDTSGSRASNAEPVRDRLSAKGFAWEPSASTRPELRSRNG